MFTDARTLSEGRRLEADVCIVGGGAAGISLARELSGGSIRVVLLESGGSEAQPASQELNAGRNVGLPYYDLISSRLRFLGGTTNHWGGESRPLDPFDFEPRDWVPGSGWPIDRSDLDPFYERAQAVCGLGPFEYDPGRWPPRATRALPFEPAQVIPTIFQRNRPLRFGPAYAGELRRSQNVHVYLHANGIDLEGDEAGRSIRRLRVACLSGKHFEIEARHYVLALGAIETTRFLLQSSIARAGGFGRSQPLIGRYFCEHPFVEIGRLEPASAQVGALLIRQAREVIDGTGIVRGLTFPTGVLRRERLPNFQIFFEAIEAPRARSWRGLWQALRRDEADPTLGAAVRSLTSNFDDHSWSRIAGELAGAAKGVEAIRVSVTFEPIPQAESRVRLGDRRDALGQPRVDLDWRVDPAQKKELRRIARRFGAALARSGIGRMRVTLDGDDSAWKTPPQGSWHQLGSTRMHPDPRKGVVDAHCRVHGFTNLHIASGSVFPTVGYANPTLSIVALALRLAAGLKEQLA